MLNMEESLDTKQLSCINNGQGRVEGRIAGSDKERLMESKTT